MNEAALAKLKLEADNTELELNIFRSSKTLKEAGTDMLNFMNKSPEPFSGVTKNGEPNPWLVNADGGCIIS